MRGHRTVHSGWLLVLVVLAFIVLMLASPALSQESPEAGRRTAEQWCGACHLVDGHGTAIDGAPPFRSIARNPAKTPTYLRTWLANPHYPMPNIELSRRQIDDLVAYILSLREE